MRKRRRASKIKSKKLSNPVPKRHRPGKAKKLGSNHRSGYVQKPKSKAVRKAKDGRRKVRKHVSILGRRANRKGAAKKLQQRSSANKRVNRVKPRKGKVSKPSTVKRKATSPGKAGKAGNKPRKPSTAKRKAISHRKAGHKAKPSKAVGKAAHKPRKGKAATPTSPPNPRKPVARDSKGRFTKFIEGRGPNFHSDKWIPEKLKSQWGRTVYRYRLEVIPGQFSSPGLDMSHVLSQILEISRLYRRSKFQWVGKLGMRVVISWIEIDEEGEPQERIGVAWRSSPYFEIPPSSFELTTETMYEYLQEISHSATILKIEMWINVTRRTVSPGSD